MEIGLLFMTPKKTTNTTNLNHNRLSIQISLSGLSFCILQDAKTITHLTHHFFEENVNPEELTQKINTFFKETSLLHQSFKKIRVIYNNNLSTFVPKPLFSEKNLSDYLKYNVKTLEKDYITYDEIDNYDLINVYIPYVNANNFFFEAFGEFEYHHSSTILVKKLLKNIKSEEPVMFVHVQESNFEIVVIQNQNLLFYNTFSYQTPEDFIYYILFTAEQLALDPEVFQLYFLGDSKKENNADKHQNYQIAYTYIRNIDFGDNFCNYEFSESIKNPEKHNEFILLNSF